MNEGVIFTPKLKKEDIEKAWNLALFACQEQIKGDCNKYCKVDQGYTHDSIRSEVDGNTMTISWNTEYAVYAYFTGKPSKSPNDNAQLMWAEYAANIHKNDWAAILQKGMTEKL